MARLVDGQGGMGMGEIVWLVYSLGAIAMFMLNVVLLPRFKARAPAGLMTPTQVFISILVSALFWPISATVLAIRLRKGR